ncbi:PadR family transcriptional regulator [Prauserella cavernicola]|uniref:Helix-turn-helix transcriptional regulator n=1 Tax=Prauserella cavernicola TaxID=2800127 RepID=A0A934QZH1_9PSEU|nr:helix-turn-helix transcriptional regulator [Prauserella cavernicola]MBK1789261.1 helix-turn-helix transcriptional regulator [Prauserella cavernicola]
MSDLNATAAALLGLLHDGPATGGELVAGAEERFGTFFSVTRSQVYRELPALHKEGLVRLGKQGPRSSQQYLITAAGKKAFKAWVTSDSGPDHLRSPLILRVVHASVLTPKQRATLLDSAKAEYSAELDEAKAAVKAAGDPVAKAVAEFGQAHARAALKLLDSVSA